MRNELKRSVRVSSALVGAIAIVIIFLSTLNIGLTFGIGLISVVLWGAVEDTWKMMEDGQ
jgi:hypothetical protein